MIYRLPMDTISLSSELTESSSPLTQVSLVGQMDKSAYRTIVIDLLSMSDIETLHRFVFNNQYRNLLPRDDLTGFEMFVSSGHFK